ncbi:MAG: YggS family pyridoxal phosphate-dependent enzyme [Proteobacteria bacterium]|nr:YggS family pyridoxal phosphate-dependent enzyme [Pseudomonadota bacterium]
MSKVYENYLSVKNDIPKNVTLTIVTKKHTMDVISELIEKCHTNFAENYVQEAQEKWSDVLAVYPDIKLKMIGRLQSNKIHDALSTFHEIHSIHSLEIANKIHNAISNNVRTKVFYVQVNIGNEEQKSGISPQNIIQFLKECPLEITGLMCIPPSGWEPSPYFLLMQNIKKNIQNQLGKTLKLSMGMSSDYQKAIKLGSDDIRIGSAILGER